MKHMKKTLFKPSTKKRLFYLYVITYIPLLLCILAGSEYGKHRLKQQSIQYNHTTISLQLATVDTTLNHISNYLASFLLDEKNYSSLLAGVPDLSEQTAIMDSFTKYLDTYNGCSSLFFYLPKEDVLIFQSSNYDSYTERLEMRAYIRQACREKTWPATTPQIRGWSFLRMTRKSYLMELMEYQNVYVGAFAASEYVFSDLKELTENTKGTLILSNQDQSEDFLFGPTGINRQECVAISVDSSQNHYRILLYIPERYVLGAFSWFHYGILALFAVTFLFLTITLIATWKQMVSPLIRMISAMKAVQKGDFDSRLPIPDTRDEFAELTETFNYMISRIHDLKLQVYEEKLSHVYAELEYLTLQIKPHFFLNCLNLIYSLGLSGRSELVAEFSSTLMKYFRYLFKSSDSMVSLNQELEHVKNYLHIQQIRFQNNLEARFDIEPAAESMTIPVLTLHTFVENTFKHAYLDSSNMQLIITASPLIQEGVLSLVLCIEDNGTGFSPEDLEKLNLKPEHTVSHTNGQHIGISNVKQRLWYIYGYDISLTFENRPEGGARIRLILPQKGEEHELTSCR